MKKLLYLVHRLPYPPNKGDKITSFNMLKYFSTRFQVYLGCFVDDPDDWQHVETVRRYCTDSCIVNLRPSTAKIRSLTGLLTGQPLSVPYYDSKKLQLWTDQIIQDINPDAALIFSGVMAQFLSGRFPQDKHSVLDFEDVDSDKWRLFAENRPWPMKWLYNREATKLLDYERKMASEFGVSIFVSEIEAAFFKSLAPEVADKVVHRVQGVDTDYFDPTIDMPSPYGDAAKVMVFVGAMNYWPNADAVIWFGKEIFPRIRQLRPDVEFYIVGMKPPDPVKCLEREPGITVTGTVADVRPYLRHAEFSVAPLRIARGIQNKVLECLAMEKPVLVTDNALEGIELDRDNPLIKLANSPAGQIEAALELLAASETRNNQGRMMVIENYSWHKNLGVVDRLLRPGSKDAGYVTTRLESK